MQIVVEGKATEYYKPDEVILELNFHKKSGTYEEALNEGTKSVENFINIVLIPNGFTKEEMKTRSFVVREERKYVEAKRTYEFDGYSYNQKAMLKFDYDKVKLAKIMEELSKLENAPLCQIEFGVKNIKECKRSILALAYKDAEEQALAIATAAGNTLKCCAKVDFKPLSAGFISNAILGSDVLYDGVAKRGAAQAIVNTFTPEDVEVNETLYCLWLAE